MLTTVNKAIFLGFVHGKPTFHYFPDGTKVCNFVIKTFIYKKNDSGGVEADHELTRCSIWGDVAPTMENAVMEGNKLYVEGHHRTSKYKDPKTKKMVFVTQIRVTTFVLAEKKR